jgi:hypothetical protein
MEYDPLIVTLLFCLCIVGLGRLFYGRWMGDLDVAARFGLSGLLGLGTVGLLTLFIGLLPGGLQWGIGIILLFALAGAATLVKFKLWEEKLIRKPVGYEWLFVLVAALAIIVALVAVLAPSTAQDWDTIAYHLAVPKLWLTKGQIYPIPYIHHSNFPGTVDSLYIWGLTWGGQSGAKAFQLCFYLLGVLTVFGFTRARYGGKAGAWAGLTFATVPVVLWEAGTGYIDVAHGLYAAVGIILIGEFLEKTWSGSENAGENWPLAALCLGFAAGSKYTGLQVFIAIALVYGIYALVKGQGKGAGRLTVVLGVAVVICAPWYIKNELWAGNPVYPFFYEQFGGKNWSQANADIYKDQQQIFGIPRTGQPIGGLGIFPDAVLGLAFQPGRYTDPSPKLVYPTPVVTNPTFGLTVQPPATGGYGFPWQSTGGAILVAGLVWLLSGKTRRFEGLLLGWIGVSFLMWFVLSQQSRYAITFAPILAMLLGAGVVRLRAGPILAGVAAAQAAGTLVVLYFAQYSSQLDVVTGKIATARYLQQRAVPNDAFTWLNSNVKSGKVALYDEVFGYYLNVPYFWANPGHTTLIGYDKLKDGAQFIARLKEMGFTYIYLSALQGANDDVIKAVLGQPSKAPDIGVDWQTAFKGLIADAAQRGLFSQVLPFRNGVVLQIK